MINNRRRLYPQFTRKPIPQIKTQGDYVQDVRYIAGEHMDVRRDCVSFARHINYRAARLCQFCTAYQLPCGAIVSVLHGISITVRRDCVGFARHINYRAARLCQFCTAPEDEQQLTTPPHNSGKRVKPFNADKVAGPLLLHRLKDRLHRNL